MTDDLRVSVDAEPEPGLLRPAIEAALTGRPWPPGPEAQVAAAVAAVVRDWNSGSPVSVGREPTPGTQLGVGPDGTNHAGEGR
ncbi:MAG TPA: hypothetical protein VH857_06120 [Actinomycetes bacterium]|jgi:hypothetical protein|nr:hypothetical protein [Actinomycetes bacterium]